MKITPELRVLKNAYMKAKSENDTNEMGRLKSKAMGIKQNMETKIDEKLGLVGKEDTKVKINKDGDSIELSLAGKQKIESKDE